MKVCGYSHNESLNKSNQIFFPVLNLLICFVPGSYTTFGCSKSDFIKRGSAFCNTHFFLRFLTVLEVICGFSEKKAEKNAKDLFAE